MLAEVARLRKADEDAKAAGNESRVKDLAATAVALQKKIHEQVFGGAPIDDILALVENDLPAVARAARVDLIVSGILYRGPGVELRDVTQNLCGLFEPDARTRKMIEQIVAVPRAKPSELSHDH